MESDEIITYRYDTWDFWLPYAAAILGIAAAAFFLVEVAFEEAMNGYQFGLVFLALFAGAYITYRYGRNRWRRRIVLSADRIRLIDPGSRAILDEPTSNIQALLRFKAGEATVSWAILFFSGKSIEFFPGVMDAESFSEALPRLTGKKYRDTEYVPPIEISGD